MHRCLLGLVGIIACSPALGADGIIDSLDELRFRVPAAKASASLVAGKAGNIEFRFDKDSQNVFFSSSIRGQPDWDDAAGFSFWAKGDGSKDVGAIQFIYDDDYAVRYEFAFSLTDTEWHKVTVAWSDLVPVLPGKKSNLLDPTGENRPSKLSALWVGKWWHWRDYPAHSFVMDDLRLETKIETKEAPLSGGLSRIRARLRRGEPITIVTMGDSLTDTRHWANREVDWGSLLKKQLEAKYNSAVTVVNPAIGGTQLRQGLVQIPRWLIQASEPDLVMVCYGGNDWEAGMRGPQFEESFLDGIKRIRRATEGKADILILTTVPSLEKWNATAELADACREASKKQGTGLADLQRAFHQVGEKERARLFVNDKVHLSADGHKLVAETILSAVQGAQ